MCKYVVAFIYTITTNNLLQFFSSFFSFDLQEIVWTHSTVQPSDQIYPNENGQIYPNEYDQIYPHENGQIYPHENGQIYPNENTHTQGGDWLR